MARIAETEEMLTIEPPFVACKGSITAFMPRNTPSWFTRKCCSNSAALVSTRVFGLNIAALFLAPIARARSLLNGGMASSLGLHPAARRHRHRRIVGPQTAGVDVNRSLRIATVYVAVGIRRRSREQHLRCALRSRLRHSCLAHGLDDPLAPLQEKRIVTLAPAR